MGANLHIDVVDERGSPVWTRLEVRDQTGKMYQPHIRLFIILALATAARAAAILEMKWSQINFEAFDRRERRWLEGLDPYEPD